MRRLLAMLIPGLLLLTACGGTPAAAPPEPTSQSAGEVAKLDSLKVSDNGDKKAPGLEFTKPLDVTQPTIKLVTDGTGDRVKAGQIAEIAYIAVDGKDGKTLEDTFTTGPMPVELNDQLKTGSAVLYNALVGAKVGADIAFAVPGTAASGTTAATSSQLVVFKVTSVKDATKALDKPEGDAVTPPAGLPTVKVDDKGIPQISVDGAAAPQSLIAQDLIKGKGAVVKETDTLTVNYVGVNLVGGKKFDSSYDRGKTASFALNGVIKGWTQGLAGKTVGSRVLLVIPKDLAYGDAGQGDAKGDLVFVVDILGAN
ncbi:FKBP-type peptidyl-prolyl cis-trans isomerase [Arthrobacter sp. MMS18-M83]|uniref:FKBP-type peptidyl-prolyl cis-trans isomerase n=1 Tax=Arthrobacter sp. MMS18-M83 TaxID=2996261 RepID=UPI00227C5F9B|nr:FKBP-type peptidyl-prolyl cis-trans isomerase [Arthrobacter sp. MMS18-M83]WAH96964.1 FKBP-type peptidyl-prolyl cis-trans isomerase [Arthrobacter sp. MMS18-M83]